MREGETFGPDNNLYLDYEYGVSRIGDRLSFRRTFVPSGDTWKVSIPDDLDKDNLGLQALGDEKQWSNIDQTAGIDFQGPEPTTKIAA